MHIKNSAFSYIEAIIATAILGVAVMGILMTVASIKKPAQKTDRALVAAYLGQQILEDLRASVDARDWNEGHLSVTTEPRKVTKAINGVSYTATYTVIEDPETKARRVDLKVDWPDPQ